MTIALVNSVGWGMSGCMSGAPSANPYTVPAAGIPAGSLVTILGYLRVQADGALLNPTTDTKGNVWNTRIAPASAFVAEKVFLIDSYITTALVSGNTINVSHAGLSGSNIWGYTIAWWSDAHPLHFFDKIAGETKYDAGGLSSYAGISAAVTADNSLVLGIFGLQADPGVPAIQTPGAGYTNQVTISCANEFAQGNALDWESKIAGTKVAEPNPTPSANFSNSPTSLHAVTALYRPSAFVMPSVIVGVN